jgi:hypothetical protein
MKCSEKSYQQQSRPTRRLADDKSRLPASTYGARTRRSSEKYGQSAFGIARVEMRGYSEALRDSSEYCAFLGHNLVTVQRCQRNPNRRLTRGMLSQWPVADLTGLATNMIRQLLPVDALDGRI